MTYPAAPDDRPASERASTGAPAPRRRSVPFTAGDGHPGTLVHVTGPTPPSRGPVLLIHGAGVRADIFLPPTGRTMVDVLLDAGYDVWLENWRASIDLPPHPWTLDQAAVYDHPVAVRRVLEETGADHLKVLAHCQGSTSFMMAAVAGLVPQVTTIVSNAVSLHPVIPGLARAKLALAALCVRHLIDYMNPQWGRHAPAGIPRILDGIVRLTHHECDNAVCRHVSFTYGAGFPTLWSHENLDAATHAWISGEFGPCSMAFFHQMARSVRAGRLVCVEGHAELPRDVLQHPPRTDARIVFMAGQDNKCYLAESQIRSFRYFDALRPGHHALLLVPGYGHLDVFLGRHAARDVFPQVLEALDGPD